MLVRNCFNILNPIVYYTTKALVTIIMSYLAYYWEAVAIRFETDPIGLEVCLRARTNLGCHLDLRNGWLLSRFDYRLNSRFCEIETVTSEIN